jgi:hypothetical protein
MNIKRTNVNRYWRPTQNLRISAGNSFDKQVLAMLNVVAKKIKVCPQATAREALNLGLVELARIANIDLKALMAADGGTAGKHSEPVYPANPQSQEKSVSNQAAMTA